MLLNPQTVAAIKLDEFAVATLNAMKVRLLEVGVEWDYIDKESGLPPFSNENDHTLYCACCALLDDISTPDLSGVQVDVGGVAIDAEALVMLGKAVAKA